MFKSFCFIFLSAKNFEGILFKNPSNGSVFIDQEGSYSFFLAQTHL